MRRLLVVAAGTAVLLLALPGVAAAEVTASVTAPAGDATVAEPVEVTVQVNRDCLGGCGDDPGDDTVSGVTVRLQRPDTSGGASPSPDRTGADTRAVQLECVDGCSSEEQTWGGVTFEPAAGAPFASQGVCNGAWDLTAAISHQNRIDPEPDTLRRTVPVTVSAPPAAPTELTVDGGRRSATVSWAPAPQPDVTGYRLERQTGDGWTTVTTVGPDTTSHTEQGVDAGRVSYRVSALRADGVVDGEPVTSCGADTGRDLQSVSAAHDGTVRPAATPGPTPAPSGDGGSPGDGGGSGGAGTGGSGGSGDGSGGSGTDGSSPGGSTGGGGTSGSDGGQQETAQAPELSEPSDDGQQQSPSPQPEPRFYGEDLGFSEQLDYGDVQRGTEQATPRGGTETPDEVVVQDLRSAGTSTLERYLDPERIAVPVAFGLLAVASGLHLRRWMNAAGP